MTFAEIAIRAMCRHCADECIKNIREGMPIENPQLNIYVLEFLSAGIEELIQEVRNANPEIE